MALLPLILKKVCQMAIPGSTNGHFLSRNLQTTVPMTMAMPLRRKKKIDPAIARAREEKRKKKLEKALTKMQKKPRIPKPLLELEPPVELVLEANSRRKRMIEELPESIVDERALLLKEWNRFAGKRHRHETMQIDMLLGSQLRALEILRLESETLYFQAIQPDTSLIPFRCFGPTRSPALPGYLQDGSYEDVTKKYAVQYADMKSFMNQLLASRRRKKKSAEEEGD